MASIWAQKDTSSSLILPFRDVEDASRSTTLKNFITMVPTVKTVVKAIIIIQNVTSNLHASTVLRIIVMITLIMIHTIEHRIQIVLHRNRLMETKESLNNKFHIQDRRIAQTSQYRHSLIFQILCKCRNKV